MLIFRCDGHKIDINTPDCFFLMVALQDFLVFSNKSLYKRFFLQHTKGSNTTLMVQIRNNIISIKSYVHKVQFARMVKDKYVIFFLHHHRSLSGLQFAQDLKENLRDINAKRRVSKKLKLLCPGQQKKAAVSFSFFDKKMETKCITATAF